jgi:ABC-2 type transport system permease protein
MSTATASRPQAAEAPADGGRLTGTWRLVRFALRRDRVRLAAWILGISVSLVVTASSFPSLYPDAAARQQRAEVMASPAAVAIGGPGIGAGDYTFGAMLTNEMLALTAAFVALMAIFTVTRHTRGDEEDGRTELVLANPVGRLAPLSAAITVALLASAAVGVLSAVGLGSVGVASIDWPGSLLYGAALAGVGIVFTGVGAVTAQVTDNGRSASGLAGLVLGLAYAVRAIGDAGGVPALSWLSPFAWAQRTYAYVDDRWWPLGLPLVFAAALVAVAVVLDGRRDLGSGLRQPRPGPARASARLGTPIGLALRLQRTALIAWSASLLAFGLMYGTLLGAAKDFATKLEIVDKVLSGYGDALIPAFLSLLVTMLAMAASVYAIIGTLRAQAEERSSRAEALLSTPVSRSRWLGSHAVVGGAGSVVILFAGALGVGITGAAALGDASVLGDVLGGAAVQVAPLLLVVGFVVSLFGWLPRLTGLAWIVIVYAIVVGTFGGLLSLPDWAMNLSPFSLVPALPAESFTPWPVLAMLVVSAALYLAGLAGLRRRDVGSAA